jgi:pseudouridine-5'-phosphate glycosidase/pseudouridine kinase
MVWEYTNSLNLLSDWRAKIEAFGRRKGLEWVIQEGIIQQAVGILPFVESLWIKAGVRGLLHLRVTEEVPEKTSTTMISQKLDGVHQGKSLILSHYDAPVIREDEVVSTTGAGDTLVGGLVAGLVAGEGREEEWVSRALEGVERSLRSRRAVG